MKTTLLYTATALLLGFSACNGQEQKQEEGVQERAVAPDLQTTDLGLSREEHIKQVKAENVERFEGVDAQIQSQLKSLTDQYLQIKEALFASNAQQTSQHAASMLNSLKEEQTLSADAQKKFWQVRSSAMQENLQQMASSQDLLQQREQFARLSKQLAELVMAFGTGEGTLYYQFCPMAFENKGGYWLSAEKKIQNPFYPEEMPGCGRVAQEL